MPFVESNRDCMRDDFHVLIVGAGATGLMIAQGLLQSGIQVTVFEATTHSTYNHRPRDWTIGLHWGRPVLEEFLPPALLQRLPWASTDPHGTATKAEDQSFPLVNGKTGEVVADISSGTTGRVSRQRIRDLLATGININYGKQLVDISKDGEKVVVHFEDGTSATGDTLIGADGVHSAVRAWLLPPDLNILESFPVAMWNFTHSFTAEQAKFIQNHGHPRLQYAVHPDKKWISIISPLVVPSKEEESWTFQVLLSVWRDSQDLEEVHLPSPAERLAEFRECIRSFCEPFRSVGTWIKDDTYIPKDRITHFPGLTRWSNPGGRVSLAGDAVHPMSPHRGQGLNNALQDASNYIRAIKDVVAGKASLAESMDAYDAEIVTRGQAEIARAAKQTFATHHFDLLKNSLMVTKGFHRVQS